MVALEALALLEAPSQALSRFAQGPGWKVRIQGCAACMVTLSTVWEVGSRTYIPELEGYATVGQEFPARVLPYCLADCIPPAWQ